MLLEAVDCPIRYEWPEGKICLIPGQTVDVSAERGAKILKKCGAKVRAVQPFDVGDCLSYQVAQEAQEGPFEVVETTESHGQWWALVVKKNSHAWIHQALVVKVDRYK